MNGQSKARTRLVTRQSKKPTPSEQDLACSIGALTPQQSARHQALIREVFETRHEVEELRNGYRFQFPYNTPLLMKISEWVTLERMCCSFFNFKLELNDGTKLALEITGSGEVKRFLSQAVSETRNGLESLTLSGF